MTNHRSTRISTLGSQLTSIISVALVLIIVGILGMGFEASRRLSDDVRTNFGMIVKMSPSASEVAIGKVKSIIAHTPGVASCTFSSAESILAEESHLMGEDLSALLDENPFGAEFDIKVLPQYACADSLAVLSAAFSACSDIDNIVSQSSVVDNVNRLLHRLTVILIAIGIALLTISFVLINNTVSLAVYSRRFIIHTMKLVGATGAFIRRPFVTAAIASGVVSAFIAVAVVGAVRAYAASFDPVVESCLPWSAMAWIFAVMIAVGVAVCSLASAMATNRYLRANYDDMFY